MKNGMVEATFNEEKVRKYYSWRASNYDASAGFEQENHAEAVGLANAWLVPYRGPAAPGRNTW